MKYFSEKLNKFYDTEKACAEAEEAQEKARVEAEEKKKALAEQRATRAKEVEKAYEAMTEARQNYNKVLNDFLKDYGSFHATFTNTSPFFSFFDWF